MNMKCTDAYRKTQVTISVPREAGDTLKYLAKFNTQLLERLGILAIRVDGCETVSVCTKPREQISQGHPQITPTSSDGLCVNPVKSLAVPVRNRYRKQASESNVSSSKQSCDIPSVPFEGRSNKILTYPHMSNVGLGSCQDPKSGQRVMEPSSSVFHSRYFNQHCSVNNISSGPCPSFAPANAFERSPLYFEHPMPGWNLTEKKPNDMNSSALKSASLFHIISSSNNVPTTSNLQSTSSIGSQVLESACMKVPKVRQRRKAKQSSSLRNYCIAVESPFHQITSASFSKHSPVPEEVSDYFGGNISPNFVRPPCKRHFSPSTNVNKTTNLTESLSESDLSAKKFLNHFTNQQLRSDGSVATELASVSPSLTAINSEANNSSFVAFSSNLKSSADCLVSDSGDLSEVKSSSGGFKETNENVIESGFPTSENIQQTVALQSSTSFHLDEKSGLLITLSPRVQSSSFGVEEGVGAMPNCESMVLKHVFPVLEGTNDETWQSENVGKVDDVELCKSIDQLPLKTFNDEQAHLLDENHQENGLDFQLHSSENPDVSEVDADVLKSNEEFCSKITASAKENLTMLDSDDPSITKVKKLSMDSNDEIPLTDAIGFSSLQQPDNTNGKCVDISTCKKVGNENVSEESFNLEMEISVVVTEDICESNEDQSVGNISPDSAVVGDVASVETIEENEMLSVPLLSESLPLDRHMEPFCNDSAISSTDTVIMNQVGNFRDQSYSSVTDIHKSSSSSDANDCESVVERIETDELNAVKFAHVNDSANNINLDNDVPGPIELTWSKLTKEDIEVIKLNNKHSALDLAVTHFEGVSRCSKSMLSEDLRRLDALVLCEFDSVVVNPSSLFCVAKVAEEANSKVPRNGNKCMTRKLSEPVKINRWPFSLCSLLAKRRMKRRTIGNIPALNREYGHLNRCLLNTSRPLSVTKKFT